MTSLGFAADFPLARSAASSFSLSASPSSSSCPRSAEATFAPAALQGPRQTAAAFAMPPALFAMPPALCWPPGGVTLKSFRSLIAVFKSGSAGECASSRAVVRQPAPFKACFALAGRTNFSTGEWDWNSGRTVSSTIPSAQGSYEQFQQDRGAGPARPPTVPWQKEFANFVQLIGTVGRHVDIKYLDTGKVVAKTSLAVKTGSLRGDDTSWFELDFWDGLAETASQYVHKGEQILVTGKILVEKWVKDDVRHSTSKVVVKDFCFVEAYGKPRGQDESSYAPIPEASNVDSTDRSWNAQGPANSSTGTTPSKNFNTVALATEKRWQEYFADPTQWWDNRNNKKNPKSPDFKHKSTQEALWLESWSNPPWVSEQMAALEKQAHHGSNFADSRQQAQNKKLSSFRDSDFMY